MSNSASAAARRSPMWTCVCCVTRYAASRSPRSRPARSNPFYQTGPLLAQRADVPCSSGAGRPRARAGRRRLGPGDLRPPRRSRSPASASRGWPRQPSGGRAEQLPRHRGRGAARVRGKINGLGLLSEYLTCRPDRGLITTALGRGRCRGLPAPAGLPGIDRPDQPLPPQQHLPRRTRGLGRDPRPGPDPARRARREAGRRLRARARRHPGRRERGEPGRDLPPEIMATLCANLDTLEPLEVRVAAQLGIDTGRRPEDILTLPLDCLTRDADGGPVLVYDNAKPTDSPAACRSPGHRRGGHRPAGPGPATLPRHPGRR